VAYIIRATCFQCWKMTRDENARFERWFMALIIGVALAISVGVLATVLRLDRDRGFYPTVTIVVASYYVLFALMGASTHTLVLELLAGFVFLVFAAYAFKSSLWIAVGALAGHGIFDLVHGAAIPNPGVPLWWPGFCLAYDVTAAMYLAWLLGSGRVAASTRIQAPAS
jgi:hypothetical protein